MKTFIHIFLIVITGIAVYSNTFHSPFVYDDIRYIRDNSSIHDISNFLNISDPRYITFLTFAINYYIGGLNTFGYHLVNLIIHILNAVLVYWLVALTFKTPYFGESQFGESVNRKTHSPSFIAFFSGLLFVSHPIQTQAVTYIHQRSASFATMFYLLSIVMYIKFRIHDSGYTIQDTESKTKRDVRYASCIMYLASLFSAILAMKTKEISFTLPFIIGLYEFSFLSKTVNHEPRTTNPKQFFYLLPFFLTLVIIPLDIVSLKLGIYKHGVDLSKGLGVEQLLNLAADTSTTLPRSEYLLTQFRVIVTYIRLLFFPINQNFLYDYPVYNSFFNPNVFLSFLFLASIFVLGVYLFYRSQFTANDERWTMDEFYIVSRPSSLILRLVSFGIFWFFITLSVESSIIPLKRDVIFEHRVYLPSIGFFIVFSTIVFYVLWFINSKLETQNSRFSPHTGGFADENESPKETKLKTTICFLLSTIIIVLSIATYARNNIWKDEITFWKDVVMKSPNRVEPHNNLGYAYAQKGWLDDAIREYLSAISLNPNAAGIHTNLGDMYADKGWLNEAVKEYLTTIRLKPNYTKAYINLGLVYMVKGQQDEALKQFLTALSLDPDDALSHYNLGFIYASKGQLYDAIEEYTIALRLRPDYAVAHCDLGLAYYSQGQLDKAIQEYSTALRLKPDYVEAYNNLGNIYMRLGFIDNAIMYYQAALGVNPNLAETHSNLGFAYRQKGLTKEAVQEFQRALEINPNLVQARQNLKSLQR